MDRNRNLTRSKSVGDEASILLGEEVSKLYRRLHSIPADAARQTDREEIRRKLAMGSDDDCWATAERLLKKPSSSSSSSSSRFKTNRNSRLSSYDNSNNNNNNNNAHAQEAEVCQPPWLMPAYGGHKGNTTITTAAGCPSQPPPLPQSSGAKLAASSTAVTAKMFAVSSSSSSSSSSASPSSISPSSGSSSSSVPSGFIRRSQSVSVSSSSSQKQYFKNRPMSTAMSLNIQLPQQPPHESLLERQQRLQQEATVALAKASITARMQVEEERRNRKKSPIAEMIGLTELEQGQRMKIPRSLLREMNLAQLQILVNDLHTQIETLNEELVHLLIGRDDLHMEQDSMLVDVEDLTSFAQRMSERNNNKTTLSNRNSSMKKTAPSGARHLPGFSKCRK